MPNPAAYTLVTGASSGIGQAVAVRLSAGRNLILHGRDPARLEQTRSRCNPAGRHYVWPFDLAQVEQLGESLAGFLSGHDATVECLVHSAGMVTILPMRAVTPRATREIMDVNFLGN